MHLTAAEWARIEALFPQLVELPAAERARLLDRECAGEPRVRAELEGMLAASATEDALLDQPIALTSSEARPAVEDLAAGTRMGAWKIRSLIGHGGMGEVYLAGRADGAYTMNAAIKLLKKELFSYANAQRFLRERRVLARLSHPNIARVLDAGTTDDGRPFLVMEYVNGTRVTDFARARNLFPTDAARLMLAVAEAVAEAHRRGVVHRDLKPANVMVDEEQQVKLLDFGIARLMDEDDSATPGVLPMTPAYAAPEQVRGQSLTPAADVYALGVMLFQLLTQRLPHTREGMPLPVIAAGLDAESPEAPSRVIWAEDGLFPARERRRRADAIADGLDAIVLKALRSDPARRYVDAGEFAAELRRWLDRQPVVVREQASPGRLRRWLERFTAPTATAPTAGDYKYWAFISYSHQDEPWATWLHRTLETYRVPRRLVGRPLGDEPTPRRLFPVFRDRDELASSHELGAVINQALRQSRNLIVVCSPRSATSRWVNEEIKAFRALGRGSRVFCLIVDGEPHASAKPEIAFSECFPPALRDPGFEPIAADARARKDGKAGSKLKLLAGILDVGLDELKQREKQRALRDRLLGTAAALVIVGLLVGITQRFTSQREAREHQIAMEQLVESGRLELLEGRQARAAVLLHEALRQGYDTVPLRFMLGQAMLPVDALGDVRVRHGGTTVRRAIFSPDGTRFVLIVAMPDGSTVGQVYDAATGKQQGVLQRVPTYPRNAQFIGDGSRLLVSGFAERTEAAAGFRHGTSTDEAGPSLAVWSLDRTEPVFTLEGQVGNAGTPVSSDGALTVATPAGLLIADAASGLARRHLERARAFVAVSYSGDGRWLAAADANGSIELLSAQDYRVARTLGGFDAQQVVALTFTPDNRRLLALSRYGDVRIWDVERGALAVAFAADPAWVSNLQFSADGRRLLTIGSEGFKVWSTARGVLAFDVRNAIHPDASAVLSPDGDYLYIADDTSQVAEIWGVRSGTRLQTLDHHTNSVSSVALDATGSRLLVASKDGTAETWRARIAPAVRLDIGTAAPSHVRWIGAEEQLVAVGDRDGRGMVATLDASTGAVVSFGEGHRGFVSSATLSQDRQNLLTGGHDGIVGLWKPATSAAVALLDLKAHFTHTSLSADGSRAAVGGVVSDGTRVGGFLIDVAAAKIVSPLVGDTAMRGLAFNPAGSVVAATDMTGQLRAWRASDGKLLMDLRAHQGAAEGLAFDSTGTFIATTGHDHAVRIWPVSGEAPVATLENPALGWTYVAKYAPDDARIAIGSVSGDAWLWSHADGRLLLLKGHRSSVTSLSFMHGGEILMTTGFDGTVRAWDVRAGQPLAVIAALGGGIYSADISRDAGRLAAGSSETRMGGVWLIALEQRPVEALSAALRCRVPWRIADGKLVQVEIDAASCR